VDLDAFQAVQELSSIAANLTKIAPYNLNIHEFEKDDDTNYHVDFINDTNNLRATNYAIINVTRMETKRIAGKIIPAIATTTAAVAGLVSLELIKILMSPSLPLSAFKNTFLNLALPLYAMSEPAPPTKIPIFGNTFYTVWDSWEVRQPEISLQQFMQHFSDKYQLMVTGVFNGIKSVYVSMIPLHKRRLPQLMKTLLGPEVLEQPFVDLTVTFTTENGEVVEGPSVRFFLR